MWKSLFALLLFASPAIAQERATAYQAMRTIGTKMNRDLVNHVISVTGSDGHPQPETWKILLEDPRARGGVREVEVRDDRIVSERTPLRSSVEDSLGAVIDTAKLNLDSSGAYTVAQEAAESSHIDFATANYGLRVDERGNPIWTVALQRENGEAAGTIYIGANHGTVTRTEGFFRGGDEVASSDEERPGQRNDEDDDGDVNPIKRQIKDAFHKLGDDVKRDFHKVRRSFVDFFTDK